MKKLATLVFALLLGASLSFAQAAGGSDTKTDTKTEKSGKKGKKSHKGAKKSKKSTNDTTATPK